MRDARNVIQALYEGRDKASILFVETNGSRVSTASALDRLRRMASVLSARGVVPGDRVSLRLDKSLDAILLAHAVMWLGAVVHPLNTAYTDVEVTSLLEDARPKILACDEVHAGRFRPVAERAGASLLSVPIADEILVASPVHPLAVTSVSSAALLYTSGTTGKPKGALISHENLLHCAKSLAEVWRLSADDTLIHPLPVYHAHGLLTSINTMLASGGAVLLLSAFEPKETIAAMQRCTVIMAVPTHYSRLIEESSFGEATVGRLRLAISGSAPLPVGLAAEFAERAGVPVIERYGSTEAAIVTALPASEMGRAGWVGWPLPDVQVRVRGKDGSVLTHGIGGLETRGPNVFEGYWNNEEATRDAFSEDGWFVTGDVAEIDAQGCVRLLGREKEIVITGGLNVYPAEIENALRQIDHVKDAAVFGVPHPDFGEAVVAAVELKGANADFDAALARATLRSKLASYKIPKSIFVKRTLPRNSMGKLLKNPLREEYFGYFNKEH